MTLVRRVVLSSIALAVPAALLVVTTVEARRARDFRLSVDRVARGHLSEVVRDACEADPNWFLAGPRTGRPSMAARQIPDADVLLPRPSADELPFEVFAYDDQFLPTSSAGPRFPNDFRNAMRGSPPATSAMGPYASKVGTGLQMALRTTWSPGPCSTLLFRMQPRPGLWWERVALFAGVMTTVVVAGLAAFWPTVRRIRRLSRAGEDAAREDFHAIAPDAATDELSAIAFVFNDAATEIHQRRAEIADRIEALRRFKAATATDVAAPLGAIASRLAALAGSSTPADPADVGALLRDTHEVTMRLGNIIAAAELRVHNDSLPVEATDVAALVRTAVSRLAPVARHAGVTLDPTLPASPLMADVHAELTARAVGNVIDNAIRYAGSGGRVAVTLVPRPAEQAFSLTVANSGQPVPDDLFKGLTAVRRFRGDEGWNRRPNTPGLGLAVAREIADRSGLQVELRRPAQGGLEVEITAGQTPTRG